MTTSTQPRHLVLLIDGTWVSATHKAADEQQSNIYWLNLYIEPQNAQKEAQICFYIPGIGSKSKGNKLRGGVLGLGLDTFVEEAYLNIVSNFAENDKIYIFGFSRGAVIARMVAYLISDYGILQREYAEEFPMLWNRVLGKSSSHEENNKIQKHCYQDISIEFLGLFDTVKGTLGMREYFIVKRFFSSRKLPKNVKAAVHILSMHEPRLEFNSIRFQDVTNSQQHLEQIWMPGVHSDIGGGYKQQFLGNISLITMLDRLTQKKLLSVNQPRLSKLRGLIAKDFPNNVTINNELEKFWVWPFSRICWQFGYEPRKPSSEDKYQYYHPICDLLDDRLVQIKPAAYKKVFSMNKFTSKKGWPVFKSIQAPLP